MVRAVRTCHWPDYQMLHSAVVETRSKIHRRILTRFRNSTLNLLNSSNITRASTRCTISTRPVGQFSLQFSMNGHRLTSERYSKPETNLISSTSPTFDIRLSRKRIMCKAQNSNLNQNFLRGHEMSKSLKNTINNSNCK